MYQFDRLAKSFETEGFAVASSLFTATEAEQICDHYMAIHANRGFLGARCFAEGGVDLDHSDPLRRYPRFMQMHLDDPVGLNYLLEPRIAECFRAILGDLPFGVQTMFYFKPAGARGQALHQDQRYLRVEPGTCVAAWMALDDIDEENGCLQIVPGSQNLPVLCPRRSDTTVSFTDEEVDVPAGLHVENVIMKKGDVLFFNGQLIHGSGPNVSKDRFRRIIVGHYVVAEAKKVSQFYQPVYRFDGTTVELEGTNLERGGPCGVTVDVDGKPVIQMTGTIDAALSRH